MSLRAEWLVAVVGIAGTALGIVFFVATQEITLRDGIVLVIGAVVGAAIASLVAIWLHHSDDRSMAKAAVIAGAEVSAAGEAQRLKEAADASHRASQTVADAEADAIRAKANAEAEATIAIAQARAAQMEKQTELLTALPTRQERITTLHQEIALAEQNANTARGNADASMFRSRDAAGHGFHDLAREHEENAKNWNINVEEFSRRIPVLREERERIEAMTDEEFLTAQKHERGLD